ncbi:helix-turn-helix domain-containing protein [Agromyces archimandritae]|uniref:Helix-turn-helix domain-containing protein n=1 Tax=Agromyces archimandritae TaxID=2781962 RepID=A0A975FLX0_9MICO|nr:helix-turn-helix domain-containing protein [Agromyces archimandritae]QTX03376.1 helix-turn-helix domain-containing protein [Agromyces archimandritae]
MTIAEMRGVLDSEPRLAILESLQRHGPQTAGMLGEVIGAHENTVRDHIRRLMDAGLVVAEREHRGTRGRPRVLFAWADGVDRRAPGADAQTARALAIGRAYRAMYGSGAGGAAGVPAPAGGSGGAPDACPASTGTPQAATPIREETANLQDAAAQFDVLIDHLDRCGFEPGVDAASPLDVRLRCPFADLYESAGPVLCQVHLRLIRSVLARSEGPLEVASLEPAPVECRLSLARTAPASAA